jgi:putative copper export protein
VVRGSSQVSRWRKTTLLTIGLAGLFLIQVVDLFVGLGLRGMSFQDQFDYLQTTAGQLYLGLLAVFVSMLLAMRALFKTRHGNEEQKTSPDKSLILCFSQ